MRELEVVSIMPEDETLAAVTEGFARNGRDPFRGCNVGLGACVIARTRGATLNGRGILVQAPAEAPAKSAAE